MVTVTRIRCQKYYKAGPRLLELVLSYSSLCFHLSSFLHTHPWCLLKSLSHLKSFEVNGHSYDTLTSSAQDKARKAGRSTKRDIHASDFGRYQCENHTLDLLDGFTSICIRCRLEEKELKPSTLI